MVTALSESYLPNMGLESSSEGVGGIDSGGGMHRFLSLNNSLMPTLSMQDRHPSAPQLASMLASSSVERKPLDMLIEPDEHVRSYRCVAIWGSENEKRERGGGGR